MIYLLEDDGSIRDFVIYTLNSQGLPARGFPLPSEFWKAVEEEVPELVLLDIMLPEEDGLTVLKKLRQDGRTAAVPVIMLTAKGTEYDKVVGLDSGADDYVAKPFGVLEVDPGRHTVHVSGEAVSLTQKEFEVLRLLLAHRGQVFSREQLLEQVWGYAYTGESRTVDVHIRTLRQKLGPAGAYIETVRGYGYKIAAES